MSYTPLVDIKEIASIYNAEFSYEIHESKDYAECTVKKGDLDLDILATRFGEDYFAYSLYSSHLPREIYPDTIKTVGFTERDRNDEILQNLKILQSGEIKFHPKPSLFNKKRGYILLSIDGTEMKIFQNSNSTGLDTAA